ncbi:VOC family protein [Flavisphingomonas formosensis]|uniref:VOC family protein n=1 Tax=Flavisphingomonas formosensis TaxID=861534 RepID=UPI001E54FAB8|nr:VOC family protein [Sphingomonas formosensis]
MQVPRAQPDAWNDGPRPELATQGQFPLRNPAGMAYRSAALPRISGAVTLFYYDEIETASHWYENVIGFEKQVDLDWLALFRIADQAYLGLVAANAGSQRPIPGANKGAILSIVTTDLEKWHRRLFAAGVAGTGQGLEIGCGGLSIEFKVRDPGGYTLEFLEWLETSPIGGR